MTDKPQFVGKKVKLGELCEICSGGTPKRSVAEYWKDGTIPWVKIGDMSEKYVSSTEERITDAGFNNSSVKMLEPGTLLYSIFASIGAVSILKIPATTNQAIAGLKIKDDSLDRDLAECSAFSTASLELCMQASFLWLTQTRNDWKNTGITLE